MKKIDLFTISFYEFTCEDSLTDRILSLVKKETWADNHRNEITPNDMFFDKELFDWFDMCLDEVRKKIGLNTNISLPITSCWANKIKKLQAHHPHNHSNSFISGIFYLTNHDVSPTIFSYPNYWFDKFKDWKFKNSFPEQTNKIFPKKSTLILFPSYLTHSVTLMRTNEIRYSLAFNTYFKGEIDDGSSRCRLLLEPKTVRDYYET